MNKNLSKNIVNLLGSVGQKWLDDLPIILDQLSSYWNLSYINPVYNMSYNYVAKSMQNGKNIVIKISPKPSMINDEIKALKHFEGNGFIKLLDFNEEYNAILIEQALPGISLKDIKQNQIEIYSDVIKQIKYIDNKSDFQHISDWLKAIDNNKEKIAEDILDKAKELKTKLLNDNIDEYILHGDLHYDNIISYNDSWICIDPKGIRGELAFEAAHCDLLDEEELKENNAYILFETRSQKLANNINIDHHRLKDWIFVRLVLGACWCVEDNGSPNDNLNKLSKFFP